MKKPMTALAVSVAFTFGITVANASVHPASITAAQAANQATTTLGTPFASAQTAKSIQVASLARNCADERYSWWEYSGWEIVGCLASGQW